MKLEKILEILDDGESCVSIKSDNLHGKMDEYGKNHGVTVVFCPWHPNPEYRMFKTGTLCSRNDEYPSGLVIVNEKGVPHSWKKWILLKNCTNFTGM